MAENVMSTRLPSQTIEEIGFLARDRAEGKTAVLREAVLKGLEQLKLENGLKLYREGRVSMWKAATIAGLSLWQFMEEVKKARIPSKYSLEDAKEDVKMVFG